jgi:energy-coupling factor transporter ATP-binding protein EcfA2
MPLVSLIAEGVGPFKSLELDLSDGKGGPHLGPHILAGVNGSGKSTILRTIAWVLDRGACGFRHDEWQQMLRGHESSRALLVVRPRGGAPYVWACSKGVGSEKPAELAEWAISSSAGVIRGGVPGARSGVLRWPLVASIQNPDANTTWSRFPEGDLNGLLAMEPSFNYAAYSPSRALRRLSAPDLSAALPEPSNHCLAFESTVQNEAIQSWLLSLYSKRAIARDGGQTGEKYTQSLERFEAALSKICNQRVSFEVDIEPRLQPCIRMSGHRLNFSQLPDGVRSTVAWVADFMMREDLVEWNPDLGGRRPGVLLLDEVDAHLHPVWQRRVLPAMREALPDVQIIATSHSPFVISSCPNSRVHVLDLDANGEAHVRPPVDAPIGDSVMTTLKGIFGVDSRFDILTERELNEWDELKRHEVTGDLPSKEKERLRALTTLLGERSEELRALVAAPREMPKAVLDDLLGTNRPAAKPGRKRRVRA